MKFSQTVMIGAIQKSSKSAKVTTYEAEVIDEPNTMQEADTPTTSGNVSSVDLLVN